MKFYVKYNKLFVCSSFVLFTFCVVDWTQPVHHRHDGTADVLVDQSPTTPQLPLGSMRQPHGARPEPARSLSTSTTGRGTADTDRGGRERQHDGRGPRHRLVTAGLETSQSSAGDTQLSRRHHR